MKIDEGFKKLGEIDRIRLPKPPAYQWQDLALRVIKDLAIPAFKRNSVFKVCKEHDQYFILRCLSDTKELAQQGSSWKYFFKVVSEEKKRQSDKTDEK